MRLDFITIFPEIIHGAVRHSIMRRASEAGIACFNTVNPRDFCYDRHLKVDDVPFGGAAGMLIKPEPVALALESIGLSPEMSNPETQLIVTDPTGEVFDQRLASNLSKMKRLVILCGHYEGIDQRVIEEFGARPISLGDYILTNGELPALIVADAVVRLLPGVLGSGESLKADSHSDGMLSAPNYTRPEVWRGIPIPDVLKSGNHRAIEKWRRKESLLATRRLRPDLLAKARVDKDDLDVLSS